MHSDPIADLLTRIRNGAQAHLATVEVPHSKIKVEILKILEAEGYLTGHEVTNETKFPTIKVHVRYDAKRQPLLKSIRRVSKPGLRVYKECAELKPLRSFILPGGSPASAALHLARTISRRAERLMVELASLPDEPVSEPALHYINRLSDFLFVASRYVNRRGDDDVLWVPGKTRSQ